jgi:hypothetical protein
METAPIKEGMAVYSADGKKLGKISRQGDDSLLVAKGIFFKKDYRVSYEDIERIEEDGIYLRLTQEQIEAERVVEEEDELEEAVARPAAGGAEEELSASSRDDAARAADASPGDEPEVIIVAIQEEEFVTGLPPDRQPGKTPRRGH